MGSQKKTVKQQKKTQEKQLREGHSLDSNVLSIINFLAASAVSRKRLRKTAKKKL